jgi:hypothetical protein
VFDHNAFKKVWSRNYKLAPFFECSALNLSCVFWLSIRLCSSARFLLVSVPSMIDCSNLPNYPPLDSSSQFHGESWSYHYVLRIFGLRIHLPLQYCKANLANSCIMTSELVLFHHRQASIELTRHIQPYPAIKLLHLIQPSVYIKSERRSFRTLRLPSKSLLLLFLWKLSPFFHVSILISVSD